MTKTIDKYNVQCGFNKITVVSIHTTYLKLPKHWMLLAMLQVFMQTSLQSVRQHVSITVTD